MAWPPTLNEDLKPDLKIPESDTRDDAVLAKQLAAAIAFVQRVQPDFNYTADPLVELPEPDDDLELGTVRLAGRWFTRRRSPDALVAMGELGASRIPAFDADIERMLRIGRFRGPVFA